MRNTTRTFLADLWALTYPYWFSEERWVARGLLAVVIGLKLGLVFVLVEEQHWAQVLSGGEQQRVAFARTVLHQPQWLFMDEATASLDEVSEERLYTLIRTRLPDTSIISIGHRPTLAQFHERWVKLERDAAGVSHLLVPV